MTEWSRRVETSEQALTQATEQLGRGSLEGAFGALATARANSSPCAQPSIDAVWGQLQQERGRRERAAQEESAQRDRVTQQAAQAAQQEKARREQEVLTELIGTMTNALTTLSAAKGGKGRPPAAGLPGGQVNECPPGQIWVDNSVLGQGTAGCVKAASSTPKATPSEPPCGRYSNECCCWDKNHRPYRMYYNFECNHPNLAFRDYICVPRRPQVMKQATQ